MNPTDPFMVPFEPFLIAQIQVTQSKAPMLTSFSQRNQSILNFLIHTSQQRHIPTATPAIRECTACQRNAVTMRRHNLLGHLSSERWPHYFLPELHSAISFACSSQHTSRYIGFKRAFSDFNCFSNASMPPYFECHW